MFEASSISGLTIRDLRRRWKPYKQRLSSARSDHPTLVRFHRACSWLARVEKMDPNQDSDLALVSHTHKRLVLSLLDDRYLSGFFWRDPEGIHPAQTHKEKHAAATWFVEQNWKLILERLLERIYLMRCQLVHGAATYGGLLNRSSLRHCVTMLGHLLPTVLLVLIDHGADEDWGIMCYPPMQSQPNRI